MSRNKTRIFHINSNRIIFILLFIVSSLSGCTKKSNENQTGSTTQNDSAVVNLSIWGNYLSPEMQNKFEKETGIKIKISNYSSSEELLTKVQMGASGIDVAVPSDYMVGVMIKMNLLERLNTTLIPNKNLIMKSFLSQDYDPKNEFSMPYTWTTVGIAVNKSLYKGTVKGWKDLMTNPDLEGKFALLDDVRETLSAALLLNGANVNSTNSDELNKAKATLLDAKKRLKMFASDTTEILKNKEVVAAQAYSSDALQAQTSTNGAIEFILPEEGSTIAIDNLVIIKGSKHLEAAHKLINFLLSQEVDLSKVQEIHSGPILEATKSKLPAEIQNNKNFFPETKSLQKLQSIHDLGEKNKLWEDVWTEVKTH